ncbi:hypothetical protein BU17DRAFT_88141 [Hysterangium stoloniferum]|nr:hypothetical protein BU17DRAFT_88141 [Hysterangium stoloniferum]
MDRLPHISAAFRPAVRRPATITFRRNAAATDSAPRLARVGPPATAQPSYLCARTCRFFALCRNITGKRTGWPMRDNGGFERRLQVFVDAIDRRGKRNDKIGMELHIRTDLGSRERLNGCIDFLSPMDERTSWLQHAYPTHHYATSSQLLSTPLLSLLSLLEHAAPPMVFCVSAYSGVGARRRGQSDVRIVWQRHSHVRLYAQHPRV